MPEIPPEAEAALSSLLFRVNDRVLEKLKERGFRSCLNCEHFTEATEVCGQFGKRPPARIIANACPNWTDGKQPF